MAITLNSGSGGSSLKTSTVSSEHIQHITIDSPLGDSVIDDTNDAVKVVQATGSLLNVTEANSAAIKTAVELIDNAVSGAGFNITQLGGASVPIGAGVEATAVRVTLATDSTGVVSIDDNGGSLTIDGTVTANLSATDNAVLDQLELNTDYGVVVGGGVEATALRVTIASDSTGVLSIDDNGGSITIDGTVTSNAGSGTFTVGGVAAENAAVSGNPVLVGGRYDSTARVLGDGDVGAIALDPDGHVINSAHAEAIALSDSTSNTVNIESNHGGGYIAKGAFNFAYNGTTWDRVRGDATNGLTVNLGSNNDVGLNAGTNLVGDVGISGARTSGGTTLYKNIDVDETEDQIKGSAGQLYWIHAMNLSSGTRYLKFYNATAASVTVGATTPDLTFPLPTQGDTNGAGFVLSIPNGIAFGTAITVAATTGIADADTGAPGANEVVLSAGYA